MAIGDKVKIGFLGSQMKLTSDNVPVYSIQKNPRTGEFQKDHSGSVVISVVGGIKAGSEGKVVSGPLYTHKAALAGNQRGIAPMGNDLVPLFEVFVEQYQQTAWVSSEHIHVVG